MRAINLDGKIRAPPIVREGNIKEGGKFIIGPGARVVIGDYDITHMVRSFEVTHGIIDSSAFGSVSESFITGQLRVNIEICLTGDDVEFVL